MTKPPDEAGGDPQAISDEETWPNVTYWPVMAKAQASAQKKNLGLWKAC